MHQTGTGVRKNTSRVGREILTAGQSVLLQDPDSKLWDQFGTVVEIRPDLLSYLVRTHISGKILLRGRDLLKPVHPELEGKVKTITSRSILLPVRFCRAQKKQVSWAFSTQATTGSAACSRVRSLPSSPPTSNAPLWNSGNSWRGSTPSGPTRGSRRQGRGRAGAPLPPRFESRTSALRPSRSPTGTDGDWFQVLRLKSGYRAVHIGPYMPMSDCNE